jgi:hypothetical protein
VWIVHANLLLGGWQCPHCQHSKKCVTVTLEAGEISNGGEKRRIRGRKEAEIRE